MIRRLDLSGEWLGVYSYPRDLAPVSFSASLRERGGRLSGSIAEMQGRRIAAIEGRRIRFVVTWLKSYEHRDIDHDIQYEGEVSADGEEISGVWTIFSDWSGTFLMVRQPRAAAGRARGAGAKAAED